MATNIVYVIITFCTGAVLCRRNEEPKCSAFDYEEQILKKVIRMEHTNELKFDEITSLTTQLKEDVVTLKTKIEEYEKAITRIKGKLTVTTAFFLTSV